MKHTPKSILPHDLDEYNELTEDAVSASVSTRGMPAAPGAIRRRVDAQKEVESQVSRRKMRIDRTNRTQVWKNIDE